MIVYFKILQENNKTYIELPTKNGSVANYQVLSQYSQFIAQDYFSCLNILDSFNSILLSYRTDINNVLQMNKEYTPFSSITLDSLIGCAKDLYTNSQASIIGFLKCDVTVDSSSDVPDYTDILTSINSNLTNLNNKFIYNNLNISQILDSLFRCFNTYDTNSSPAGLRVGSLISSLILCITGAGRNNITNDTQLTNNSFLRAMHYDFKQSASPNASITDVISSLNANIHNDLTNINTTAENKDNVLIVDGQQTFKIRNSDEEI